MSHALFAKRCAFCKLSEPEVEIVFDRPKPKAICNQCVVTLAETIKVPGRAIKVESTSECSFCPFFNALLPVPGFVPNPTKLMLQGRKTSICQFCLNDMNGILSSRGAEKSKFFDEFGPECGPERCIESDCDRLRIRIAPRCLLHQYNRMPIANINARAIDTLPNE